MTCGECVYCVQNNVCDGDCKCNARSTDGIAFDVSQEDDTRTYGSSDGTDCEFFVPRAVLGQIEQTIFLVRLATSRSTFVLIHALLHPVKQIFWNNSQNCIRNNGIPERQFTNITAVL